MSYQALYRKYRPQSFKDVSDQEHITRTLMHAIKEGRISHAYLFSGPRGIGKTTVARIFAKAINCLNPKDGEPCGECDICKGIDNSSISDIIEIDAASNTGVDDMRELRDKVKYLPSMCKYKVYIIDEVHMLSTSAFNALLKTLEEPPKHVIFILCTTEPQKVLATIRSRCQRFDFHLISNDEIVKRLITVCNQEKIKIDSDALNLVAEVSEGGMRDALSLLDQAAAYASKQYIQLDDVLQVSGKLSSETMIKIATALREYNSLKAITLLEALVKIGKEIPKIIYGLIVFYKDILVIKNVKIKLNKVGYNSLEFQNLVVQLSNQTIYNYINILTEAQNEMRFSSNQRLYLELAFIKMSDSGEGPSQFKEEKAIEKEIPVKKVPEYNEPPLKEVELAHNVKKDIPQVLAQEETITSPQDETKEKATIIEEEAKESYDIRLIEKAMNNSSKPFREKVIDLLPEIIRSTRGTDLHKYVQMIMDSKLVVASQDALIFTCDEVGYCNHMMNMNNKEGIKKIFTEYLKKDVDIAAIPEELWSTLSSEFVKILKINKAAGEKKYITITYVPYEGLKSESIAKDETKERHKDLFNAFKDIIKIKDKD